MRKMALLLALLALPAGARDLTPKIEQRTLPNGLRVYLLEDHSAPIFTFQFWVEVGSADEHEGEPGITGLSHFFEHMMFRGTEKHPSYFQEVASKGGQLNAFTWIDETVYWEKLGRDDLEFVLELESDRLKNMKIDFLNLEPEREVVKSERLLRTENSPSGALGEAVGATLFKVHPYHWPTVGWMRDLNAITVEQAQAYHAAHYTASNAFIVLVGDFSTAKAMELVTKYYGDLPAPLAKMDVPRKAEPPQTSERRTYVEKQVGTGLFQLAYRAPAGADDDFAVLEVIDTLLTGGKRSRLQQALVFGDDPLATSVSAFAFPFEDVSTYQFEVEMLPEKSNRVAEERLTKELERLQTDPVPAEELQRAVAQLRASVVARMSTTQSRADMIGYAVRGAKDPTMAWKRLARFGAVTPEDVRRVAKKWLPTTARVVGHAVDPRQVIGLIEAATARGAGSAVLVAAARYAGDMAEAHAEQASIAMEAQAIALLDRRAKNERARLASDEKALAKLDEYLTKGEKGTVVRTKRLEARKAALAKTTAALAETAATLRKDLEKEATQGPRHAWAAELLGAAPVKGLGDPPDDEQALAEWALRGLSLKLLGRESVPDVAPALAARAPKGAAAAVWDFAHTVQSVDAGRM